MRKKAPQSPLLAGVDAHERGTDKVTPFGPSMVVKNKQYVHFTVPHCGPTSWGWVGAT